ncbi:hypothetical protein GCK32_001213 [Trichostrongylus colubriformis]|uniref:Uncharacterized protein n=1 Tax=Trichostrongylus colubriformis TaxID=6319 RepID=A0AAN8FBI4_TRICO
MAKAPSHPWIESTTKPTATSVLEGFASVVLPLISSCKSHWETLTTEILNGGTVHSRSVRCSTDLCSVWEWIGMV